MPLLLVPTPLGNLGDITLRAIEALRDADIIVAEDTRVARKLCSALGIAAKAFWSYREQNALAVTEGIIERARAERVALVTDAGMPSISDPGSDLVAAARAAGVTIEVLPGPSAVLGVAVLSGFSLRRFAFEGFLPRGSSARREAFAAALRADMTTIWYESPKRIGDTLRDLASVAADARVFLVREYTKRFEEQLLGTPDEVAALLIEPVRGEIAFAVAPYGARRDTLPPDAPEDTDAEIDALLAQGLAVGEIAKQLARRGAGERRELYARASERKRTRSMGTPSAAEKASFE
jgi:16S rRNA (cytidine1402-2'-O)-methyltransferase